MVDQTKKHQNEMFSSYFSKAFSSTTGKLINDTIKMIPRGGRGCDKSAAIP